MGEAKRRSAALGDRYRVDETNGHTKKRSEPANIHNADAVLMKIPVLSEPTFESITNQITQSIDQAAALDIDCFLMLTNDEKGYSEELRKQVEDWSRNRSFPVDVHLWMKPCERHSIMR